MAKAKVVGVRLDEDSYEKLQQQVAKLDRSMSWIAARVLKLWLRNPTELTTQDESLTVP